MFKRLRLWLIKKLKATPNEMIPKVQVKHVEVPIKTWEFKKQVTDTSKMIFSKPQIDNMMKEELYKELKEVDAIEVKSNYNQETDITTYYARVGIAQEN